MLALDDLINIKYIPDETEISLLLLIDFYENYLCKRFFQFTLCNGEKVGLFFQETTEIFHISGIEHIYKRTPMNAKKFIEEVKNGNIDLATLNRINHSAYIDFIDRIRSMACLDAVIKNCEYLSYPNGKIPNSTIKVSYLLLKGMSFDNSP